MSNTIKLKPVSQMGASLEPGELVIDEVGRKLYLDKGTGPEAIPLDREPLPKTPRPVDPDAILIKGASGPEWALLQGAGGGPPMADETGYLVPGCRPYWPLHNKAVTNTNPAAPYTGNFHVTEDVVVRRMLIRPLAGEDILFTFGIRTSGGVSLFEHTESAYAGDLEMPNLYIPLSPGDYQTYVSVEAALSFRAIGYREPWALDEIYSSHIVWLRFN